MTFPPLFVTRANMLKRLGSQYTRSAPQHKPKHSEKKSIQTSGDHHLHLASAGTNTMSPLLMTVLDTLGYKSYGQKTKLSKLTSPFWLGCKHNMVYKCHLTTVDTPQYNRVAESLNCRLMEHAHAILHQANLPKTLWAEAVLHVVWLKNHTSMKALGTVTPYEKLYKEKPNLVM